MFPVRRVNRKQSVSMETLGSKPKFWFREGEKRLLFKAEDRGTGEDWAEVVASELCEHLGLPHVVYELAAEYVADEYKRPGTVCENMATAPVTLFLGNDLLLAEDPDYPKQQRFKVRQHTVQAVAEAVWHLPGPKVHADRLPNECRGAGDVFTGYLMLDAWIANTDRHHENWGVLWDGETACLAETFDHGVAFAHSLLDTEREERLRSRDRQRWVEAFVSRGRSALYLNAQETKPLGLLEAFASFASLAPDAATAWIDRLRKTDIDTVAGILDRVPSDRMSGVCKEFTLKLLEVNRQRLLDLKE